MLIKIEPWRIQRASNELRNWNWMYSIYYYNLQNEQIFGQMSNK